MFVPPGLYKDRVITRANPLCRCSLLAAAVIALSLTVVAVGPTVRASTDGASSEPDATGWSFYVDNDYLSAGLSDDQGYTGGFGLSLSGRRAVDYPWSLDPVLSWIDQVSGWASLYADAPHDVQHSWQVGTLAFTPSDTDARAPIAGERPYAGLVFIGNTQQVHLHRQRISYLSNFTLGALGTDVPESIQNGLHDLGDQDPARGWDNQIADGGEPTFLWEVQRRETHWSSRSSEGLDLELNSVLGASVGFLSGVRAGVTGRWGDFSTPWWSFTPDYAGNIATGQPGGTAGASELYLWGGLHLHQQIYNAFLEGQFRDSAVTFDRSRDLDSTLWELNLGVTWGLSNGYHVTLALRGYETELRHGGERPAWGSLIVGRRF